MSEQEMQFADPDWQPTGTTASKNGGKQESVVPGSSPSPEPYQPRPINDAWREQPQASSVETRDTPYQEGYNGLPPYTGYTGSMPPQERPFQTYRTYQPQNQQFPYRRRRRRPWLWIIVIILFFSLMGGGFSSLASIGQKNLVESQTFSNFGGTPAIVLHETSGNISVQQGAAGSSVTIQTDKHAGLFDDPNNIQVSFKQAGDAINVIVNTGNGFLSDRSVDFTITVPQDVNLDLQADSGDMSINNITGQATLISTSGNISASDDTFSANSSLQTTSGDVKTARDSFGDSSSISSTSGDISMDQDTLQGSEKFNNTSGNIDFNGTIDSNGRYQFNATSGDINIGLQQTDNFSVNATTTSGSINADDFPSIQVQNNDQGTNSANGTVGTSPFAQFTLSTVSGDINIHQG
jgi:hypothetical protein